MSKPSLQQGSGSLSETTFRDSHNSEVSLKLSIERVSDTGCTKGLGLRINLIHTGSNNGN